MEKTLSLDVDDKISLRDDQIEHVLKIKDIYKKSKFAFDFSSLGSGKTYTSSYLALDQDYKFKHIIVIAPVTVLSKWNYMKKKYKIPLDYHLSYCSLRSVKSKQPKHGLLSRCDHKEYIANKYIEKEIERVNFEATDLYKLLIKEGLLLIFDEIQNLKNITSQFAACQALINPIINCKNNSKILMLSGSPIDKEEQTITIYRCLNIMKSDVLIGYVRKLNCVKWIGMQDIIDFCNLIDPDECSKILLNCNEHNFDESTLRKYCYILFQQIVKSYYASSMLPPNINFKIYKYNAFYNIIDHDEYVLMCDGVRDLSVATSYDYKSDNRNSVKTKDDFIVNKMTKALIKIETAKIGIFIRIAKKKLETDQNIKVAILVNFKNTINLLLSHLAEHNPMILNGSVSNERRKNIIDLFQAPNNYNRLLIGNLTVCSTGIDLDDKNGNFSRFIMVSPNYSTISLYQLGHRFLRSDTKSNTILHMIYAKHSHELRVLNALSRKSIVMKETTKEQANNGIVFPGDIPSWDENVEKC